MSKNEALIIRTAHVSEAAEIASISRQQVEYGLNWRWTPARVKRSINDKETIVLIASEAGVTQGFAIMKFAEETAHLLLLAVQPKMRRGGIGTSMLNWLEKSCVTAGIQRVRLEVRATNHVARRFYENLGYRLVELVAAYYDRSEAAIVMQRELNKRLVS